MKTFEQVKAIIAKEKQFLRDNYNVNTIGIFGSYALGKAKPDSDIDILIEFFQPIDFFKFIRLEEFLSSVLGLKVDLVTKKALKPLIKEDILSEAVYL